MSERPLIVLDADGVITRMNDAAVAVLGRRVGSRCHDVMTMRCHLGKRVCRRDCAAELIDGRTEHHDQSGVLRGASWRIMCTPVGDEVMVLMMENDLAPAMAEALTPRESEVLRLVADGLTGRQIQERLGLGRATVRTHVEHAREKLGCRTRAEAVARALALGLIDLSPSGPRG